MASAIASKPDQARRDPSAPEPGAEVEMSPDEMAAMVLAHHDGNHMEAIKALLADTAHLRLQLALTTFAMSKGFTRGWLPDDRASGE